MTWNILMIICIYVHLLVIRFDLNYFSFSIYVNNSGLVPWLLDKRVLEITIFSPHLYLLYIFIPILLPGIRYI